jgi:hypothetical protein
MAFKWYKVALGPGPKPEEMYYRGVIAAADMDIAIEVARQRFPSLRRHGAGAQVMSDIEIAGMPASAQHFVDHGFLPLWSPPGGVN